MGGQVNYSDVVRAIEARGVMPDRPPSLEPMREALKRIDYRYAKPEHVIIVAGTNGKGNVSATLDALLRDAGVRTGLYTSPHLRETTERFRIAGEDVSREVVLPGSRFCRLANGRFKLSHFEMLTAMAARIFSGGPGRADDPRGGLRRNWDATNAIPHGPAIITQLGLDHQNLLGDTLAEVARNKFGVVTTRELVVHAPLPFAALAEAKRVRERTGSRWQEAEPFEHGARAGRPREFWVRTLGAKASSRSRGRAGGERRAGPDGVSGLGL